MTDLPEIPGTVECRERIEHTRHEARRRYREHLAAVFDRHSGAEPAELADAALDALTVWRYVDSGKRCTCSCHPRLPETHLHDYGFDCVCARPPEERRRAFHKWLDDIKAFWQSPEDQKIKAAEQADEAELQAWLAEQPEVTVHSHGGFCPEEWSGDVDGHNFYFRERHDQWRIQLDLRHERELDDSEVIAYGTTDIEGYGTTPAERSQFIVDTIRIHLTRRKCVHHRDGLSSIEPILGTEVRWCPACGTRLTTQ
jgi:hypothetical protein